MNEPTDTAIDTLILEHGVMGQAWPTQRQLHAFARAVLAKWGTPPAVAGEKVYLVATGLTNEAGTVGLYERHDRFVPLADCEVLYTAPQPTQAQAGAVPLTHDEALDAFCHTPGIHQFVQAFMAGVRFAEQHHGIKGGQHG